MESKEQKGERERESERERERKQNNNKCLPMQNRLKRKNMNVQSRWPTRFPIIYGNYYDYDYYYYCYYDHHHHRHHQFQRGMLV